MLKWLNKENYALKLLMIEQIYIAVLAYFIVETFHIFFHQLEIFSQIFRLNFSASFDWQLCFKFLLVLSTLIFYYCDYYYIKYTKEYKTWFFICDLIFCLLLLGTIKYLNIQNTTTPFVFGILVCYSVFMFLYLLWDFSEYKKVKKQNQSKEEKRFYEEVLLWELLSIFYLVFGCFKNSNKSNIWWLIGLVSISIWFIRISKKKERFFKKKLDLRD